MWLPTGTEALVAAVLGGALLEVIIYLTIEPVVSRAASGQTTGRRATPPIKRQLNYSFTEHVKSLSPVPLFATPWSIAHQAPLSMGFSRQEYWSGLPFPSPSTIE